MNYVYTIGAEDGPYKVGISTNIKKRLGTLQSASHARIHVHFIAESASGREDERAIHDKLKPYRMVGEWFSCEIDTIREAVVSIGLEPIAFEPPRQVGISVDTIPDLTRPMTPEEFRSWVSEMRRWPIFKSDDDVSCLIGVTVADLARMKEEGADYVFSLACRAIKHNMAPYSVDGPVTLIEYLRSNQVEPYCSRMIRPAVS